MEEKKEKNYFLCSYFRHISLCFYLNFDRESLLDAESSNEYPLCLILMDPSTQKTRNTWKNMMMMLIPHPTSSPDRNLNKNIGRYVENTNKKSSFFMIPIPKFILIFFKTYTVFKSISLANTWWHGIWIRVERPILSWNFL